MNILDWFRPKRQPAVTAELEAISRRNQQRLTEQQKRQLGETFFQRKWKSYDQYMMERGIY